MRFLCFGLGYSVTAFLRSLFAGDAELLALSGLKAPFSVTGTVRNPATLRPDLAALQAQGLGILPLVLKAAAPVALPQALFDAASAADCWLISIAPESAGDLILQALAACPLTCRPKRIIYLSTIGVYGNQDGGLVDEETPPNPKSARSVWRRKAELQWQAFAEQGSEQGAATAFCSLRLAGIYGPQRNALESLRQGIARRLVKPQQVFNRIHVADIAKALALVIGGHIAEPYLNVSDDEPAPPQDIVAYAAKLMGVPVPPDIDFTTAARDGQLSAMTMSFYAENKRASNLRLRTKLARFGLNLTYPTYREGILAEWLKLRDKL